MLEKQIEAVKKITPKKTNIKIFFMFVKNLFLGWKEK
jgi:hypothetical protein